jgi:hypothetical protein
LKTVSILVALAVSVLVSPVFGDDDEKPVFAPNSEIHLFDLSFSGGKYALKNGRNISNSPDYDNQPYFTANSSSILFSSSRDGLQTDIYEYAVTTGEITQITDTKENEFSPKPVGNSGSVSFVTEGRIPYNTVWQLERASGEYTWLLNSNEPVGYYHMDHDTGDVLFWSRFGWSVQYLNPKENVNRFVSGNAIPSSPQKIPNSDRFSFVHRQTNGTVWIKSFDPTDFAIRPIAPIPDSNYEYSWAPNGDILRFQGNALQVWPSDNADFRWQQVQDLSADYSGVIARLSVSHDGKYLAIVETK